MIEKALSLTPWWAAIVAANLKSVENRKWPTSFRGEFYIHASIGKNADCYEVNDFLWGGGGRKPLPVDVRAAARAAAFERPVERGAIIACATLVDCIQESDSPWFFGPYGFVLENVQRTPVVACKGALGFWTVPADVQAQIARAA